MLTKLEAKNKVDFFLTIIADGNDMVLPNGETIKYELIVMDDNTIERDELFVFFYNSKEYLLNNNASYALVGNGGIIVDRCDGNMYMSGTSEPIEYYINKFISDKNSLERIDF